MFDKKPKIFKRTKTFTTEEVCTLLDILYKYRHIVECKTINTTTSRQKEKAWNAICHVFNKVYVNYCRTPQELRTKYENLKKLSVKRAAGREPIDEFSEMIDDRIRRIRTGNKKDNTDYPSTDVTNLLDNLLNNPDHEDTKPFLLNEPLHEATHEDTTNEYSTNENSSNNYEFGSFKRIDLSKLNDPLKEHSTISNPSMFNENQPQIHEMFSESELIATKLKREIEIINIEHTRRLEIMNREHELMVEKLKLEIELLKKK